MCFVLLAKFHFVCDVWWKFLDFWAYSGFLLPPKKTNGEVRGKRKTTVADIPFLLPHELFHELIQAGQTQV